MPAAKRWRRRCGLPDAMQTAALPKGALRIADLGYFSIPVLAAYDHQGVFWLTRYQATLLLFDAAGQPLDLLR